MQARERVRDGEGQDLRLHFLFLRQVPGHGLKARRLAVLQDQMGILAEPDFVALLGSQGIFVIGVVQLLDELAAEEPVDGIPLVRMDEVQVLFADEFLFFVPRNRITGRIHKGNVPISVRPDDDLSRLLDERPVPLLAFQECLLGLLALGDFMQEFSVRPGDPVLVQECVESEPLEEECRQGGK